MERRASRDCSVDSGRNPGEHLYRTSGQGGPYRMTSSQSGSSFSQASSHSRDREGSREQVAGQEIVPASHHHHHHRSHHNSREGGRGSSSSSSLMPAPGIVRTQTAWFQRRLHLRPASRGAHLITDELLKQLPELGEFAVGLCHIQVMHTSASLALNENWDPDVREDVEMFLTRLVPESLPFRHSCEGPDDMPAHIKACFLGSSLTIPITGGRFNLGTWQGVWLCEHRNRAGSRKVMVTINGALRDGA